MKILNMIMPIESIVDKALIIYKHIKIRLKEDEVA